MNNLFEELKQKIESTDTEKLTEIQKELMKVKDELTDEEFHRLKEAIGQRLSGFNL